MDSLYTYMLGKSKRISAMFNAEISRWTAIAGLLFTPTFFFAGISVENEHGLLGYALIFYGAAVILFIPFLIEIYLTSNR